MTNQYLIRINMCGSLPVIIQRNNPNLSAHCIEVDLYTTMLRSDSRCCRIPRLPLRSSIELGTNIIKILIALIAMCNIRDAFQIIPLTDDITKIHLFRLQDFFRFPESLFRLFTNGEIQIISAKSSRYDFPIIGRRYPQIADRRGKALFQHHCLINR